jgi:quinolinate synthase
MTVREMQDEILRLKKEKDVCILAHAYQSRDVIEIADFMGDSFGLSEQAAKAPQQTVIMCGVRFMAETVKILSPEKKVYLSASGAGCPMAEQMTPEAILELKKQYPEAAVVAYINTTAELKTVCDVCVTSASALKIVESLPQKDIIFIPDINLGSYIASKLPEKNIITVATIPSQIPPFNSCAIAKTSHATMSGTLENVNAFTKNDLLLTRQSLSPSAVTCCITASVS